MPSSPEVCLQGYRECAKTLLTGTEFEIFAALRIESYGTNKEYFTRARRWSDRNSVSLSHGSFHDVRRRSQGASTRREGQFDALGHDEFSEVVIFRYGTDRRVAHHAVLGSRLLMTL